MPEWLSQGLYVEAVVVALTSATTAAVRWLNNFVTRRTRLGIPFKLITTAAFCVIAMAFASYLTNWVLAWASIVATLYLIYNALRPLMKIGVIEAFANTESGIGYSDSLKLAHQSISFMGIGAHKLTLEPEFERAIRRCTSGGATCRFMLSPPENPLLEKLAKQNNSIPNTYEENVRASQKKLAGLKINSGLNIEVRYHPAQDRQDFQQFRLMFLDGDVCLMSWAVWDAAMGRNNPQILLRKSGNPEARKATLFKAFEDYFEETWNQGSAVPLESFL